MAQFVITYLGGDKPTSEEEVKKQFSKFQEWLALLGESAIKPMVPFKNTHSISPDGSVSQGSSVAISGHTIIEASSIEEAVEIAKGCPFLHINGSLEVAELVQM
ncbi:MAG: YciI family protein [Gammaproteobacteria bacterium]